MKLTKKQELALALADFKEIIQVVAMCNPDLEGPNACWSHSIWACKNASEVTATVTCHGGEPNRYWFDKRIVASELRGMLKGDPEIEYFVFRCGAKRSKWTIVDAKRFANTVTA
jgi:hypothetical protein